MSNYKRFVIINKNNTWFAAKRVMNKHKEVSLDFQYEGETKDRLWTNIKEKANGTKHYRRRGEWVIIFDNPIKTSSKEEAVKE